ncbi:hypothetical protein E0Z10_g1310 [Xylaria hypoxylon]|uniref:C3H1-type domain-containing protein n=1 Tax=Xylaria hypoxylon TaxID=37992 RepID=A0A4Z0Z6X3_9PEZI|nr:hypothetical protein E0Z10_g1310 [Xylaria hypoxylon]
MTTLLSAGRSKAQRSHRTQTEAAVGVFKVTEVATSLIIQWCLQPRCDWGLNTAATAWCTIRAPMGRLISQVHNRGLMLKLLIAILLLLRTRIRPPRMLLIMPIAMAVEVAPDVTGLVIQIEVVEEDTVAEAKSFATTEIKDPLMGLTLLRSLMQRFIAKRRSVRPILSGLTPGDESSEGEGALDDEEKRLSDLLGADVPVISDMAAWVAERKANFPTKARTEAKKASNTASAPRSNDSSKPAPTKIDKDQAKIDKLEKKLSKLKGSIEKRKRAANDEGDEMRADESPGLSDSSDDEEPEVQTSSKPATAFLPPPPITRADPSNHCKYYSTGGTCGKKGKCRFKHDPAVREAALQERTRNGGRMTLKQRLLLNDKDHEDMDVVKAIVEMRTTGRLVDPQNLQVRAKHHAEEQAVIAPAPSTLPTTAGIASLPPNPYASSKKTAPHMKSDQVEKPQQEPLRSHQNTHLGSYLDPNQDLGVKELP